MSKRQKKIWQKNLNVFRICANLEHVYEQPVNPVLRWEGGDGPWRMGQNRTYGTYEIRGAKKVFSLGPGIFLEVSSIFGARGKTTDGRFV